MTGFYVRWGPDVDPHIRRLASDHITSLSVYCDGVAEKIVTARARANRVAAITCRVDRDMLGEEAHHRFRKFGFHFVLRETPDQPAKAKKCEFVLNFAVKPKFEPDDMPQRLRKRKGKSPSARPSKPRRRRSASGRATLALAIAKRRLYKLHKEAPSVTAVAVLTRCERTFRIMVIKLGACARTLHEFARKMWRRRPHAARWPRSLNQVLTRISEPLVYAPVRAWLEPRLFDDRIGLPLLLNVLASREPTIDWDAFPFGEPPAESERLRV